MTDKRIIYPTDEGGIAIVVPAPEWLAQPGNTLEVLAAKTVPQRAIYRRTDEQATDEETGAPLFNDDGTPIMQEELVGYEPRPYRIVDVADIPTDRTFRAAWEYAE